MMCVGRSSCRRTRGRSMVIDRQGERKRRTLEASVVLRKAGFIKLPYQYHTSNRQEQPPQRSFPLTCPQPNQCNKQNLVDIHTSSFPYMLWNNLHLHLYLSTFQTLLNLLTRSTPPFLTSAGTTAHPCLLRTQNDISTSAIAQDIALGQ